MQEPDDAAIAEMSDLFKEDTGRRIFAHLLRQAIVDVRRVSFDFFCSLLIVLQAGGQPMSVTKHALDALSTLVLRALSESNLSNGADYISGKYFLQVLYLLFSSPPEPVTHNPSQVSYYLYAKSKGHKTFLEELIRESPVWRNLDFWEGSFSCFRSFAQLLPQPRLISLDFSSSSIS